jgi:malate synthase
MVFRAVKDRQPELELIRPVSLRYQGILTPKAMSFIARLVARFETERLELMAERVRRQAEIDSGALPDFDENTSAIRDGNWQVAPIPQNILDRRTEITGPVTRKMVINALNSGAQVYMADFEDSTAPTWENLIEGQINLFDAVRRQIDFTSPEGKDYCLNDETAVMMVRPRGLHLPERHARVAGKPIPGALLDFGLYLFHNHAALKKTGSQPYFYLPKLQDHAEAAWWNRVMRWAEAELNIPRGTIRVTVLIETLPAVFQMHEILYALRERILGLNCGRWDYIFSYIKTFRNHADRVLPNRDQVTMMVPFLRAYSRLLIQTCHQHGAFAMGGMAAQIPVRDNPEQNAAAMEKVRADKAREAGDGHDGTWVAHPGLEALSRQQFDAVMKGPNQIDRQLSGLEVSRDDLIETCSGTITESGVRGNVRIAIQYLAAWLAGNGCVPINHLMEDAATAEISRAQLWQWSHHGAELDDGREISPDWLDSIFDEELQGLAEQYPEQLQLTLKQATGLLAEMTSDDDFATFLTLPAYEELVG